MKTELHRDMALLGVTSVDEIGDEYIVTWVEVILFISKVTDRPFALDKGEEPPSVLPRS